MFRHLEDVGNLCWFLHSLYNFFIQLASRQQLSTPGNSPLNRKFVVGQFHLRTGYRQHQQADLHSSLHPLFCWKVVQSLYPSNGSSGCWKKTLESHK